MSTVVRMMRMDGSGLDIRDRQWLKITIPNAFIGSELVDWLHNKVEGLQEKGFIVFYLLSLNTVFLLFNTFYFKFGTLYSLYLELQRKMK